MRRQPGKERKRMILGKYIVSVADALGGSVAYEYDADGNLISKTFGEKEEHAVPRRSDKELKKKQPESRGTENEEKKENYYNWKYIIFCSSLPVSIPGKKCA